MKKSPLRTFTVKTFFILLCLCLPGAGAEAAWRAAGDVQAVERRADGVVLTLTSGARVAVTFHDLEVVRVRLAPRGTFGRDFSYAVESKDRKTVAAKIVEGRDEVRVSSLDGTTAVIKRRPFLVTVLDPGGRVVVNDDPAKPHAFDPETGEVEAAKLRPEWETYYGFGEKAMPMSRHTQHIVMWNTDTYGYPRGLDPIYQSIGFFIALRRDHSPHADAPAPPGLAYGLFFDNTHRAHFDMGKTAPQRYTFGAQGGELNYYVFTGGRERSPKRILRDYTNLTGRTPQPPLWALGNQQSRWSYFPESRVREVARGFRETRTPADVLYLDIDYMDGYRVFTWDKTRFPDPTKLVSDLRRDGFRTVVIIDPGIKVDMNYGVYREGQAGGHFVKDEKGAEFHGTVWPGVCAFPDFTAAAAREWFASYYRQHLAEGIAGFWNDMNEPGIFLSETTPKPDTYHHPMKTFPLDARHAGDGEPGTHARYHNVYGMQMARATFEGLRKLRPDERPFVLTRAGYAGIQRFSAVWTGDNVASWDHLRLSIPMLTNLGVSGVPFVGADVGGFSGNPSPELYARWLQAAALTPFLRSHSESGSNPHEPYAYGPQFTDINRASIELRYRLLPYLYSVFHEHTETGAPVMRPLWFEHPNDTRTYLIEDQYLVGRDLLVAPVVTEGVTKRRVYFPQGSAWVDWWTGELHVGGAEREIEAPLGRLPLFARVGATIATQPVVQHTGEMSRLPLTLAFVAGAGSVANPDSRKRPGEPDFLPADATSRLYEDAGEGYEYRAGASRLLTVTESGGLIRLTRAGSYNLARPIAGLDILNVRARPSAVRADGRAVADFTFDERARRLSITLPAGDVSEIAVVP